MMEGGRGSHEAHSPGLVVARVRSWVLAVLHACSLVEGSSSEGGGVMEDGRRGSDGGVGSKSSLTWACRRPCPFMHAGRCLQAVVPCAVVFVCVHCVFVCVRSIFICVRSVFVCVHSFPFVSMRHCPWAFVSVSGHASSSVGVPLHLWALVFICVWLALFVHMRFGIVVRRWEVGGSSWPFVV